MRLPAGRQASADFVSLLYTAPVGLAMTGMKTMAILTLRTYPDKCLLKVSRAVENISSSEAKLLQDMVETMYAIEGGIGLAAPQVGVNKRIAVVDAGQGLLKLINPEIVGKTGSDTFEEGCLSVPRVSVRITRAAKIRVRAMDENAGTIEKEFVGMTAKAVQQEIDHLDGKLILDYLPWYKRIVTKFILRLRK